jgi:endonuclease YncB( thermonuclease family)
MRDPIRIILVGVFIGGVLGAYFYGPQSQSLTPTELTELWERYKPTALAESKPERVPESWEQHYRRVPDPGTSLPSIAPQIRESSSSIRFAVCSSPTRVNCVVDGDTFWYRGQKIRIADINTPEISSPKCPHEERLGHKAKDRLIQLLNAGPFQVVRTGDRDKDRYGRLLRVIVRDGQSLGMTLVREGLAHVWDGSKHPWC